MSHQTDLAQLYTAFFNRAPDAAGLAYWVAKLDAGTITLEAIAKNWVDQQPEGHTKYPDGLSSNDFIKAIYTNVLNRTADDAGMQYWQNQLDSGAISRDVFLAAVISGAHANTSAQGLLDAQLLTNKADVGLAFADKGLNDTSLAAKVLTTVNASADSLSITLSLIKLVPASASGQTPELLTRLSDTLGKVAALISGAPSEVHDLATYLSTVSANAGSTTDLGALLTKIDNVTTAALTDPTALNNPADLANTDVSATTPNTGGGSTPTTPEPPALTATIVDGVLKLSGTGTSDVLVDVHTQKVTIGAEAVTVTGTGPFLGVNASTYANGKVTAVGTVKEIVAKNPTYIGVDSLEVVDKAWTILTWADNYLKDVQKISVLNNAAGTLSVDWYNSLVTLTGTNTWTHDIRDTATKINSSVGMDALSKASQVVVADTLVNLESVAGGTAIDATGGYIVLDTWAHISSPQGSDASFISSAQQTIVHDTVAGMQAAISAGYVTVNAPDYEVEDTATNLLAINQIDVTLLKKASSVLVTGDDAGVLNLSERLELGTLTDDDYWAYSIKDSTENILANAKSYQSNFSKDASSLTAITSSGVDALDGDISTHSIVLAFNELNDATTFTFATNGYTFTGTPDTFTHFNATTDKIDLNAYVLTGQDTLSLVQGETNVVMDGHFAVLNNVTLNGNAVSAASEGETAGTLILWDADTSTDIKQVGVWLPGQEVGAGSVLHVVD
jgi:hypothetical protein